ncbi:MAG: arylsulfatase [Bacteroidota bacterium]
MMIYYLSHFPFSLSLALAIFCLPACRPTASSSHAKHASSPNIIFIMSDDQGQYDLGSYGGPHIRTPFLDQMAAEGMRFTQAYAGSPVCAPTRCSLMTGKHSGHITRRDNRASHQPDLAFRQRKLVPLNAEDYTMAEMLKEAGYATGGFGKWGLGNPGTTGTPYTQGFDLFYGYLDQVHAHSYYTDFLMRNADTIPIPENANGQREVYSHDLIAEEALRFIRDHQSEPFFLYLPYTPPHGKYEVPDNSAYADQQWPERVKNYAAMITRMDRDIGRMFALLKELGLDENTIVFFTSDHGPNPPFVKSIQSNHPFRGIKRQVLEGGLRVPMIVRWPGKIQAGTVSDFVWAFWDVMPTFADLAGIRKELDTDGLSVLPTLLGKQQEPHQHLYWEFYNPFQQAVRMGQWKGIRLGTEEDIRLFDLHADIREEIDVASKHPEIVTQIETIMAQEHVESPYWPTKTTTTSDHEAMIFGDSR